MEVLRLRRQEMWWPLCDLIGSQTHLGLKQTTPPNHQPTDQPTNQPTNRPTNQSGIYFQSRPLEIQAWGKKEEFNLDRQVSSVATAVFLESET